MKKQQEVKPEFNKVIIKETMRTNGTIRIQQDFSNCPTLTEQHTAYLTNINYLMEKFQPDELAAYIAARNQFRQEIQGHDFSREPNLMDSMNHVYNLRKMWDEEIRPELKSHFKNHVEFLKFIDNPSNAEKMIEMGMLTKKQVESVTTTLQQNQPQQPTEPSDSSLKK